MTDYEQIGPSLHDIDARWRKAQKILAILKTSLGTSLDVASCLDVGCASGLITRALAPHLGHIIGLEKDTDAVAHIGHPSPNNLLFILGDAEYLPVHNASFDLVVCAQVYEHVADAQVLVSEIFRVLKPGGACFFSGPNRLDIIERHYGLPFVSWLPQRIADAYIRAMGKGVSYSEHPRTYWALKSLWSSFTRVDFTWKIVKSPEDYACVAELGRLVWLRYLPEWLLRLLTPFYPNYNWMLFKPSRELHLQASCM